MRYPFKILGLTLVLIFGLSVESSAEVISNNRTEDPVYSTENIAHGYRGLINIPQAQYYVPGDLELLSSVGYYNNGSFGFDIGVSYAAIEQLNVGAKMVNFKNFVSFLHLTLFELPEHHNFALSTGFHALFSNHDIQDSTNYSAYKSNLMGHFLMGSFEFQKARIFLGLTQPQFARNKGSRSGIGEFFDRFDNVIAGFYAPFGRGDLLVEFDGEDFNLGYRHRFSNEISVDFSGNELTQLSNGFSSYDEPLRQYTLTVRAKRNFYRRLDAEAQAVSDRMEATKANLEKMSESYATMEAKFSDLSGQYSILGEQLKSLELLQNDLKSVKQQFQEESNAIRRENKELLDTFRKMKGEGLGVRKPLHETKQIENNASSSLDKAKKVREKLNPSLLRKRVNEKKQRSLEAPKVFREVL